MATSDPQSLSAKPQSPFIAPQYVMRLLILNWKDPAAPDAGGAERYVQAVAHEWTVAGHEVTLFVPRPNGRPARENVNGITYLRQGTTVSTFHWARRHLRHSGLQYDHVLESVSTRPYFAHRVIGGRTVVLYHQIADDVWDQEFARPVAWVGRRLVEPAWLRAMRGARVIANSPSTAADLQRFGVHAIGIVPPGCERPPAAPQARRGTQAPRLMFIGRLVRTKRPDHALTAFRHIVSVFPGATLDIIGVGYLFEALRRQAPEGVCIRGGVTEAVKAALLDSADLLLIPATREGWGIVAMEAAAYGVPAVAYDVPGLRDSVVDALTGVLTHPTPGAMASAAIDLLRDPSRRLDMARAAYERAGRFSWKSSADRLLAMMVAARTATVAAPVGI